MKKEYSKPEISFMEFQPNKVMAASPTVTLDIDDDSLVNDPAGLGLGFD